MKQIFSSMISLKQEVFVKNDITIIQILLFKKGKTLTFPNTPQHVMQHRVVDPLIL